jgi:hypothetical protein
MTDKVRASIDAISNVTLGQLARACLRLARFAGAHSLVALKVALAVLLGGLAIHTSAKTAAYLASLLLQKVGWMIRYVWYRAQVALTRTDLDTSPLLLRPTEILYDKEGPYVELSLGGRSTRVLIPGGGIFPAATATAVATLEARVPGSLELQAKPPRFAGVFVVDSQVVGHCFRIADELFTAAHVAEELRTSGQKVLRLDRTITSTASTPPGSFPEVPTFSTWLLISWTRPSLRLWVSARQSFGEHTPVSGRRGFG